MKKNIKTWICRASIPVPCACKAHVLPITPQTLMNKITKKTKKKTQRNYKKKTKIHKREIYKFNN